MDSFRSKLERLSTSELAAIACTCDIELVAPLDRFRLIEELLYIASEGERSSPKVPAHYFQTDVVEDVKQEDVRFEKRRVIENDAPSKLPYYYNVTVIYAIVRDPLWVFVSWELLLGEKKKLESRPNFGGYFLKVTQLKGVEAKKKIYGDCYSVAVGKTGGARYIHFGTSGGVFRVELCVSLNNQTLVLAVSEDFNIPKIMDGADKNARSEELWRLSGINEFEVLKNAEVSQKIPVFSPR
ncbi:MAG: DUF4912 domain-containing protein [Spirochaetaceae bacterium]|jgi:hypothetical protein|nr:DUF4912 domain-containing protein [Spirochaetaceae bacterium]